MNYALNNPIAVPIFNIDKRPFALLCAYNAGDHTTPFVRTGFILNRLVADLLQLEGHELSYLRAIGESPPRVWEASLY